MMNTFWDFTKITVLSVGLSAWVSLVFFSTFCATIIPGFSKAILKLEYSIAELEARVNKTISVEADDKRVQNIVNKAIKHELWERESAKTRPDSRYDLPDPDVESLILDKETKEQRAQNER